MGPQQAGTLSKMILLQGFYGQTLGLDGTHCSDACLNSTDCGEDWNSAFDSGAADFHFVFSWGLTARRIDDEINLIVLDHVDDMGPSFAQLKKAIHTQARRSKCRSSSTCGIYPETKVNKRFAEF